MTRLMNTHLKLDGVGRCSGCQTLKPSAEFHRDCTRTSGLTSRCKACENLRRANRIMTKDLRAIAEKHPALGDLIVWAGERLAA